MDGLGDFNSLASHVIDGWDVEILVREKDHQPPSWRPLIEPYVPEGSVPNNKYVSLVILFRKGEVVYAQTTGWGYVAVAPHAVSDFGTEIAQKTLNPNELVLLSQKVPTGNVYGHTRFLRGKYMPASDPMNRKSVLKALKGKCLDETLGLYVEGKTSLSVSGRKDLADIVGLLDRLEELWASEVYTARIGGLEEVGKVRRVELDEILRGRIDNHQFDEVLLGYDDDLVTRRVQLVKVGRGDPFDLDDVAGIMRAAYEYRPDDPSRVTLHCLDDLGEEILSRPLFDLVEGELDDQDEKYFRITRRWYKTNPDYRREMEERFAEIAQLDGDYFGAWPTMGGAYAIEDVYLEQEAARGLVLAHIHKIDNVEVADLIDSERKYLIHVKRGRGAFLRNLFAQGYVSADLLQGDPEYRKRVEDKFDVGGLESYTVVLAICPEDKPDLDSVFTLFAKVDLIERVEALRARGVDVCYAIIPS
jgi:uncharacterized protein (TIGR04141 family)